MITKGIHFYGKALQKRTKKENLPLLVRKCVKYGNLRLTPPIGLSKRKYLVVS